MARTVQRSVVHNVPNLRMDSRVRKRPAIVMLMHACQDTGPNPALNSAVHIVVLMNAS